MAPPCFCLQMMVTGYLNMDVQAPRFKGATGARLCVCARAKKSLFRRQPLAHSAETASSSWPAQGRRS